MGRKLKNVEEFEQSIESALAEILDYRGATMFRLEGEWTIYSPVNRVPCSGTGKTIAEAVADWDKNLEALTRNGES